MLNQKNYRRRFAAATADGFTMIEMLTVIAIIALLAAIIFPVFATVRESARRTQCMSNMKDLARAVKQYQLDNREYPQYLFGPALDNNGNPMTTAGTPGYTMRQVQGLLASNDATNPATTNAKRAYAKSLFPEYINDFSKYYCPNNTVSRTPNDAMAVVAQRYEATGSSTPPLSAVATLAYYPYDSYDTNQRIIDLNGNLSSEYIARYSRLWMPLVDDPTTLDPNAVLPDYKRQLYFKNPGDDTYITACTWHAPKGKVIILWLSGTAKVIDVKKLNSLNLMPGAAQADADVWRVRPSD